MRINDATPSELEVLLEQYQQQHRSLVDENLQLDLTRGKPSSAQLDLSNTLDGILEANYRDDSGVDLRNYGGLDGIASARALFSQLLQCSSDNMLIGGNSSLSLMHYTLWFAYHLGITASAQAWKSEAENSSANTVKIICPCPGYDRHFSICEQLGIEMITVPLTGRGPDMDKVEALVTNDPLIKAIWCVPRFSNPTGEVYCDDTVERIAKLGKSAGDNFLVLWDNAYSVHAFSDKATALANINTFASRHGTEDSIIQFGSTSKITFAGAGVGFMAASDANLNGFKKHFGMASIGADKINQMRHVKFFEDAAAIDAHMQKHAEIVRPKFEIVARQLSAELEGYGEWSDPEGGYFVSFNTIPGLAKRVVALAAEAGVKLTPAGSTYPNKQDPENKNIRIAPTFPSESDVEKAMQVFCCCVKLATVLDKTESTETA